MQKRQPPQYHWYRGGFAVYARNIQMVCHVTL